MVQQGSEGKIRRREGVQISQRVDDPVDDPSIEDAVALEATYKGKTQWVVLANGAGGGTVQGDPVPGRSLKEWAVEQLPITPPEHRYPEIKDAEGVTRVGPAWYDDDNRLVIREDAEVLERIDDPMDYDGKSVALAARIDGVEWWWLKSGSPAYHEAFQRAGSGDFRAWVDKAVRDAYSQNSAIHFGIDDNGKLVTKDDWVRVIDQISDPDIDWVAEPGEHSVLVQYEFTSGGPGGRRFTLIRTRNSAFKGAIETVSFSYHPENDTLQTILARLQKENHP